MKILYVKNNSERHRSFQLKTVIYEENGQKYVKKEALNPYAIPHLHRMKENYTRLSNAIIDKNVKLAKIVQESENSLTFEFIDGISFEEKIHLAIQEGETAVKEVINDYIALMQNTFKTTDFNHQTMVSKEYETLFGTLDYSKLDGELCFEEISNLDLIFSNIIFKEETIYIIDYEWTYDIALPINYIIYRTLLNDQTIPKSLKDSYLSHVFTFSKMERHFIDQYVMRDGFYFYKKNYIKVNYSVMHHLQEKDSYIHRLSKRIHELDKDIEKTGDELHYARTVVQERDQQLQAMNQQMHELIDSYRPLNLLKRVIKKAIPTKLKEQIKKVSANKSEHTQKSEAKEGIKSVIYQYKLPQLTDEIQNEIDSFTQKPLISIIMPVYNVDPQWLHKAIESIESQWYQHWELCLVDDKSTNENTVTFLEELDNPKIKIRFLEENLNISGASNAAIELAQGEYIVLMDNDDEITPDAFYEVVKAIQTTQAEFIYSDEDFISTEGECSNPHFKPDFSPDLLLSHNYITHLTCIKRALLDRTGYFDSRFDGSQDYDLFLRLTEQTTKIHHIPKVLYHWRMLESSTSANAHAKPEALTRGKKVLEEALKRRSIEGSVEEGNMPHYFKVRYNIDNSPLVSIIIPFKDKPELLKVCVHSILEKSTYQKFEIIGISNNSEEAETFQLMAELEQLDSRISFYEYNVEFNYADINNHAVRTYAKGEHILLLNNDIEVISPDWIEAMLEHSQREEVGCVGAKLYYPNDTVQHAGIIIGLGGYAGHSHKQYRRFNPGYFNRLNVVQNLLAVTAACLMIKKSIYLEINGMDEVKFKVAYNDVDFCLRVYKQGYLNIFTPFAEMYHHESISRGYETTPEKIARFQTEKDALYERHKDILDAGDPYYNPNLTLDTEDFSLCPQ